MPVEVDQVMYACTGSEVNDLALRVAEMRTGATGVVITRDAYHGNTASVTAISPSLGGATSIGPNVRVVAPPDTYRVPADELASRFAADVTRAADDLSEAGHGVSCLIVDTIFSSDGIYRRYRRCWAQQSRRCAAAAECSSPTRCSPDSPAPVRRCGASTGTASSPTS